MSDAGMNPEAAWHGFPLRVRYQETDRMDVVFHGNYVTWFEVGRTEWIRAQGLSYRELEARGLLLPVVDLHLQFMRPAVYDDTVVVFTKLVQRTALRLTFASCICRAGAEGAKSGWYAEPEGERLVEGETTLAWLNANWRPARIEREAPDVWERLKRACP